MSYIKRTFTNARLAVGLIVLAPVMAHNATAQNTPGFNNPIPEKSMTHPPPDELRGRMD